MKAGAIIISVGDELLAGRVVDSNAHWLSSVLRAEGFPLVERLTVVDDVDAIARAVRAARARADVVVVGGGLGPTRDDLTRDGIARALGVATTRDPDAERFLIDLYARRGRPMPEGNLVQADLPCGTTMLHNPVGTAPGIVCDDAEGLLVVLPGVPGEFRAMVTEGLVPRLQTRAARGPAPILRQITIAGLPEVRIGEIIADLMERGRDPVIGSYPKLGRVVLAIESAVDGGRAAERRVEADLAEIRRRLGDCIVGDGDLRVNEVVGAMLLERSLTIAVAESLTGGLIADGLVEVPGISAVFLAGFATYANQAKIDLLGVPPDVIERSGAVSEECVRAMAEGARCRTGAALAIATTGIAGPTGGSAEKPVGTTWFGLADAQGSAAVRYVFLGDRASIRVYARERAFDLLRRYLLGLPLESALAG